MTTTRAEGFTPADLAAFPRDPGRTYALVDGVIVISAPDRPGGLTRADRDALPAIGARQEVLDGRILVSGAPNRRHQDMAFSLAVLLRSLCPPHLHVLMGPFDVAVPDGGVIEPDIIVARRDDLTEEDLPTAPVLSVEVLSPSTRRTDLGAKRRRLAEAGCPSYWLLDPHPAGDAGVTVLELDGDDYVEVARVTGDDSWTAERPFPLTLTPNALLDA